MSRRTTAPLARRQVLAIATVLAAMALAVLDAGMTHVALPSLARAFGVTPAQAVQAVTAYQAGLIMALLPMGALGERLGHRRVFTLGVAVFGLGAALGALAPGLSWLVAARFVQGVGGAGVMALGMALLRQVVSDAHLGRAIGWNALTVALASAAGPSLGALVLVLAGWRGLLALDLPIAGLVLLCGRALPASRRGATRLDVVSMGLCALMFAAFVAAAQSAMTAPRLAMALLAAALVALAWLARREAPKPAPLLPLDLLRGAAFRLSVLASVCCFAAQGAGLVALPFLLQHRLQLAPLAVGLCITAWPLSVAATAVLAGRLADRVPTAWLCALGCGALAAGLAACGLGARALAIVPAFALAGAGFGLFQTPNNRNLFLSAPAHRSGAAGGVQGTARVSGQTLGALLMSLLFGGMAMESALATGFAISAALALVAAVASASRGVLNG